ncbi:E3 ubiquitin-protein ligase TRIM39-like [Centropristis striata]|uniref:E3 ubiquitin-protein ligase TRIM39-like n=1 Tax=Centropristis striata TaxID=184440 RepID=UPI0027E16636|nr:E3 ubiquitin-protein ligase TRIM39-like [Centropristis striata]XP_059181962.1 E3 ubiquitin-protein ligase TRIM39-like [Centropristis striata]
MATREDLWKTLQKLKVQEFKEFKWFLKDNVLPDFPAIPAVRLEMADRQDTVDLMEQQYGSHGALKITITVLQKIQRNDLVQSLLDISSRPKDLRSRDPAPRSSPHGRKKAKLVEAKAQMDLMIQERRMKILEINRSAESNSKSAERHIADSRQVFAVLQQAVDRSLASLIKAIEEKRETMRKAAQGIIQELEREISELTKRSAEVERLSDTEDHPDFLQNFSSLNIPPATKSWTEVSVPLPSYGGSVGAAVNQLEELFKKEKEKLIAKAKLRRVQQFAKDVTLDPDTANRYLILSDDGKKVYCGDVEGNLPDNPERFNPAINVLAKQSFSSGRFYYEVEVKGKTSWDLGVVKESIVRKGRIKPSPETGYWTLCVRTTDKNKTVSNHVKSQSEKVGVFVDYEEGSVSFFDVDSAHLLHSFTNCSFTEKLYPFFSPGLRYDGKNSKPLTISAVNYTD